MKDLSTSTPQQSYSKSIATAKDWVFPRFCVACGAEGTLLCAPCQKRILKQENTDSCVICNATGKDGLCASCRKDLKLQGLFGLGCFKGALRELLHGLKYEDLRDGSEVLGEMLAQRLRQIGLRDGVIIPIPLSGVRQRERGYNQAGLIARHLANKVKMPILDALARSKTTQKQTTLSRQDRFANLENAFVSRFDFANYGGTIYLLDDVLTTGATMSAASAALRRSGARSTYGIVVATG